MNLETRRFSHMSLCPHCKSSSRKHSSFYLCRGGPQRSGGGEAAAAHFRIGPKKTRSFQVLPITKVNAKPDKESSSHLSSPRIRSLAQKMTDWRPFEISSFLNEIAPQIALFLNRVKWLFFTKSKCQVHHFTMGDHHKKKFLKNL